MKMLSHTQLQKLEPEQFFHATTTKVLTQAVPKSDLGEHQRETLNGIEKLIGV
jgi:hypothetical protein